MSKLIAMDERLYFDATLRNREFIGEIIKKFLTNNGTILEIASGSGEHAVYFQKLFPNIIWQASDPNLIHRKSISSWIKYENLNSIMPEPIDLDVLNQEWNIPKQLKAELKIIVCINMLHITPFNCTKSLLKGSSENLKKNGLLIIYGPFLINGKFTSKSNEFFHNNLKRKNNEWGIRELEDIKNIGKEFNLIDPQVFDMPANNHIVVLKKE